MHTTFLFHVTSIYVCYTFITKKHSKKGHMLYSNSICPLRTLPGNFHFYFAAGITAYCINGIDCISTMHGEP